MDRLWDNLGKMGHFGVNLGEMGHFKANVGKMDHLGANLGKWVIFELTWMYCIIYKLT